MIEVDIYIKEVFFETIFSSKYLNYPTENMYEANKRMRFHRFEVETRKKGSQCYFRANIIK